MKLGISQKSSFLWYKQIAIVGECFLIILVAPRNIDISAPSISALIKLITIPFSSQNESNEVDFTFMESACSSLVISNTEFVDEIAVELTDNCKYPFLSVIAEFIYSTLLPPR